MKAYVIRRLLLMIPTFFGISLVIFAVLNLAPGRPGSQPAPPASPQVLSIRNDPPAQTHGPRATDSPPRSS
jgi:ABC-type microcin C transport system permease subunit YejB